MDSSISTKISRAWADHRRSGAEAIRSDWSELDEIVQLRKETPTAWRWSKSRFDCSRDCDFGLRACANARLRPANFDALVHERAYRRVLEYDAVYRRKSDGDFLSAIDHPSEPSRTARLRNRATHLGSAKDRQAMHAVAARNYRQHEDVSLGSRGRTPGGGSRSAFAPEWFYKGKGSFLRAHGEPLVSPPLRRTAVRRRRSPASIIIGEDGQPWRIGMCNGNEFSDHRFEKRNYLNLASSKLRTCSLGPELTADSEFQSVAVKASIVRDGESCGRRPPHWRSRDVPQPAEHRASSLQVRGAQSAGGCSRSLLWRRCTELRRRRPVGSRRRHAGWLRRLWADFA